MIKLSVDYYMDKNGLSIQEVSKMTGLSRNTVSQLYNNSGKGVQFETLDRLTKALNISVHDLIIEESNIINLTPCISYNNSDYEEYDEIVFRCILSEKKDKIFSFPIFLDYSIELKYFIIDISADAISDDSYFYDLQDYFDNLNLSDREWLFANISKQIIDLYPKYYSEILSKDFFEEAKETKEFRVIFKNKVTFSDGIFYNWDTDLLNNSYLFSEFLIEKYDLVGQSIILNSNN